MSDTINRSTLGVRQTPAGHLQFHVRLPDVSPDRSGLPAQRNDSTDSPRGMKVLNRILDEERPRARRTRRPRRLPYISALLIALSCGALVWEMTRGSPATATADQPESLEDEFGDLETPPTESQSTAAAGAAGNGAAQGAIQTAGYQTSEPAPTARTAWLEGSILPDEPETPRDSKGP